MKINFTKREYKVLLEMIYLADWMRHAHEAGLKQDAYRVLAQKILSLAGEFGCEDLVEHCEDPNEYMPSQELEDADTVRDCIEEYDDATFWEELITRLARRDVLRKHTKEELLRMTEKERAMLILQVEESYADEFELNGLGRIKIE